MTVYIYFNFSTNRVSEVTAHIIICQSFLSVSAQGYEYDNLYVHFFLDLPNSKSTYSQPHTMGKIFQQLSLTYKFMHGIASDDLIFFMTFRHLSMN